MKSPEIELPSNRRFGLFFTFIFLVAAAVSFHDSRETWTYLLLMAALVTLVITLIKSDTLIPLNKLWMRLGLILGMIVSPFVLGVLFYGLFTPIGMLMRLKGRDELRLKFSDKESHWIVRSGSIESESFKKQF